MASLEETIEVLFSGKDRVWNIFESTVQNVAEPLAGVADIDKTGGGVDNFRKDIIAYARDSKMSIEDINRAIYAALSAGIDYEQALKNLNVGEELSADR